MTRNEKIAVSAALTLVGVTVLDFMSFHKRQKTIRRIMTSYMDVDPMIVEKAAERIVQRYQNGYYINRKEQDMITDFEFECIVANLEL